MSVFVLHLKKYMSLQLHAANYIHSVINDLFILFLFFFKCSLIIQSHDKPGQDVLERYPNEELRHLLQTYTSHPYSFITQMQQLSRRMEKEMSAPQKKIKTHLN